MTDPIRFCFGLHLHQPVGNFDRVFADHLATVYRPVLEALRDGGILPVTLHVSGPLLEWLERRAPEWLDTVGRLAADGRIELLLSGYDEPILAMLPRADRLEQVIRMREALRHQFGVQPTGLWLTERVWEPDLAVDLAAVGVEYALVDDRHFLVAGFERGELHRPWVTEAGGQSLSLLAIDEHLRYLVPFRPPGELADYLRGLRAAGQPLAVLADDGEKFGGWPGTYQWVYEDGWMRQFQETLRGLVDAGEIRLLTCAQALREVAANGPAYLPSASYREMETWALPAPRARALRNLEEELGTERMAGLEGTLVRGTHWRHFLAKYSEANRLHKKMVALSTLCRERGDPPAVRRAIGRAQCNDAYWHGVFGGLYLPFLRGALWRELATAEAALRRGQALQLEERDYDCDGRVEILVHDARQALVISPVRGGVIEEWLDFASGVNLASVLTRRHEAYHLDAVQAHSAGDAEPTGPSDGAASIHDLEHAMVLDTLPPIDDRGRALGVDRVVAASATMADFEAGSIPVSAHWGDGAHSSSTRVAEDAVEVVLSWPHRTKRIRISRTGELEVQLHWDPSVIPPDARVTSEWSCVEPVPIDSDAAEAWRYTVETVAKSERGLDRTRQGDAVVLVWPAGAGTGWARVRWLADVPGSAPG